MVGSEAIAAAAAEAATTKVALEAAATAAADTTTRLAEEATVGVEAASAAKKSAETVDSAKGTHRFFDTTIRLMYQENRRIDSIRFCSEGKSILSCDSRLDKADTIMIRIGGETILS